MYKQKNDREIMGTSLIPKGLYQEKQIRDSSHPLLSISYASMADLGRIVKFLSISHYHPTSLTWDLVYHR
jgi:hypothetical protein